MGFGDGYTRNRRPLTKPVVSSQTALFSAALTLWNN